MCGGIAASLSLGSEQPRLNTLAYHGGRLASYSLLGGLIGFLAGAIQLAVWLIGLRYLAGLMMVGMGLYITGWWLGMARLERWGARLWKPVQALGSRLVPARHWYQAMALGLCWGLLPCGLIYSSLAWASTSASAPASALLMLCFGLGTLPAMLAASFGAQGLGNWLRSQGLKKILGVLLICGGLWTCYSAYQHSSHTGHTSHKNPGARPDNSSQHIH